MLVEKWRTTFNLQTRLGTWLLISMMSCHLKPRQCNAFVLDGFRMSSSSNICYINDVLSSAVPVLHTILRHKYNWHLSFLNIPNN